jgi:hypothetical protein
MALMKLVDLRYDSLAGTMSASRAVQTDSIAMLNQLDRLAVQAISRTEGIETVESD